MSQILCTFASFLPQLISFTAGFAIAIFAEPVRRFFFKPKLKSEFQQSPYCISKTYDVVNGKVVADMHYIRVKVTNTSKIIARDCRAYLINIEKKSEKGKFASTCYCDSIQLAWSCQKEEDSYRGIDISKGVNQYLDVIATKSTSKEFKPLTIVTTNRDRDLFKETGEFLLTIQVSAHGADPKTIKLEFDWNGIWDNFAVRERE